MFISGYGCYTSWRAKGLTNYWRKKITRLYVPYLLSASFQLLVLKNSDWKIIIHTLLGLDRGYNIDKTMWYFSFILFWYLIFWIGAKLLRKRILLIVFVIGVMIWMYIDNWLIGQLWNGSAGTKMYVFSFGIGVVLGALREININDLLCKYAYILLWFSALVCSVRMYRVVEPLVIGECILHDLSAAIFLLLTVLLGINLFEKIFVYLGNISLMIYCIEGFFINNRGNYFYMIPDGLVRTIVVVGIIIIGGSMLKKLVDRILVKGKECV